jgi:hypothetical protein
LTAVAKLSATTSTEQKSSKPSDQMLFGLIAVRDK